MKSIYLILVGMVMSLSACASEPGADGQETLTKDQKMDQIFSEVKETIPTETVMNLDSIPPGVELLEATFGAGCFWCVEAVFQELHGVYNVESGYAGGHEPNPTYKDICTGNTGHAEVAKIRYNPSEISYDEILEVFWRTHDPTTLNQQGNDRGTQYRSAVFYHNAEQKAAAEHFKTELDQSGAWDDPIVTTIEKYEDNNYYVAEDYHQNYYSDNPNQGYCQFVIAPKMEKFRKAFKSKLKTATAQ